MTTGLDVALRLAAGAVGTWMVVATVLSAVRTVVLPRGVVVRLTYLVFRLAGGLMGVLVRLRRLGGGDRYRRRDALLAMYAPISLLLLPAVWLTSVLAAFTLLYWAVGVRPLSTAFVTSGSALVTLGFERPDGLVALVLTFVEGGLAIAALALLLVTYLPTMYTAFIERERVVALLEVRAGSPPSGAEFLSRAAQTGWLTRLDETWLQWESWFVQLRQTHTALPMLAFFRSVQLRHSWVTSAGAVLDAAALLASVVDLSALSDADGVVQPGRRPAWEGLRTQPDEDRAQGTHRWPEAEMCIRAGYVTLRTLAEFFGLDTDASEADGEPRISVGRDEFDAVCSDLQDAGVPLVSDHAAAWDDFVGWRVNYEASLLALARLTLAPAAPWSADRVEHPVGAGTAAASGPLWRSAQP